jgi:hypothetical protein
MTVMIERTSSFHRAVKRLYVDGVLSAQDRVLEQAPRHL